MVGGVSCVENAAVKREEISFFERVAAVYEERYVERPHFRTYDRYSFEQLLPLVEGGLLLDVGSCVTSSRLQDERLLV